MTGYVKLVVRHLGPLRVRTTQPPISSMARSKSREGQPDYRVSTWTWPTADERALMSARHAVQWAETAKQLSEAGYTVRTTVVGCHCA
jgi:hypothetical protein